MPPAEAFVSKLNEQIGNEFAAHQQYVACAVYYDSQTLPQLARFFYRQALEERDHAMMMVQFLIDTDAEVTVPGVSPPQAQFGGLVEPIALALDQERRVALLETFVRRPGEVLSRLHLLEHAWDLAYDNRSNVVDVYVRRLRRKIDEPFARDSLETVRGAGYRLRRSGT